MSTNLIEEVTRRLVERGNAQFGEGYYRAENEAPYVGSIVGDVLDILSAEGRIASAIEPGLCWEPGHVIWPGGNEPRCELRAGHAGAHECDRGSMGGTAVWTNATPAADREQIHETTGADA